MSKKRNVVLYLDAELVTKTRELGFNLSKTFENHLKQLVNHVDGVYRQNNSHVWWAGPDLNRRPSARQADVLTVLDDRPFVPFILTLIV
jgi:post-segregation antitoxin (ccd killing protein)